MTLTTSLATHGHARQVAAVQGADAIGARTDKILNAAWRDLLAILRQHSQPGMATLALQRALRPLLPDLHATLSDGFAKLAEATHESAARVLMKTLPPAYLKAALGRPSHLRRPVMEAGLLSVAMDAAGLSVTSMLPTGQPLSFVPHPRAKKKRSWVTVNVPVASLDRAWSQDEGYYIPPGGGGGEIGGRREEFERFLEKGEPIEAPEIHIDSEGVVSFNDGRHRFSVLRDQGVNTVAVSIEKKQLPLLTKHVGVLGEPVEPPPNDTAARNLIQSLLFPPPDRATVYRLVRGIQIGYQTWEQRMFGEVNTRFSPAIIAGVLSAGYAEGLNQRQIATRLLPAFHGIRTSARRIARTYGMAIAHEMQMRPTAALGDLVIGWTVHAVHGNPNSRWWHLERDGTEYFKQPKEGQKGLDKMPHPPFEADDPHERPPGTPHTAFN